MNYLHHHVILLSESSWMIIFHAYSLKWKGMKVVQCFSSQERAQLKKKKNSFLFNKSHTQGFFFFKSPIWKVKSCSSKLLTVRFAPSQIFTLTHQPKGTERDRFQRRGSRLEKGSCTKKKKKYPWLHVGVWKGWLGFRTIYGRFQAFPSRSNPEQFTRGEQLLVSVWDNPNCPIEL